MIFIKKVGERVILLDESWNLISEFQDSSFVVQNDRVLIQNKERILADLPLQSVGLLY